jgi:hypothetical protein
VIFLFSFQVVDHTTCVCQPFISFGSPGFEWLMLRTVIGSLTTAVAQPHQTGLKAGLLAHLKAGALDALILCP